MSKAWRRAVDAAGRLTFRFSNIDPIVVLGNQKSGTSAIASLLSSATGLSCVIDIPEFWGRSFQQMHRHQQDIKSTVRKCHRAFRCRVIKEPNFTFLYPQLKSLLPRSKFVFVVRDPAENLRSIAERLTLSAEDLSNHIRVTDSFAEGWRGVFDDSYLYRCDVERLTCGQILALRWRLAAQVYLQQPNDFFLIRYKDFVANKVSTIERLAGLLSQPVVNDISALVNVPFQAAGARKLQLPAQTRRDLWDVVGQEAVKFGYENANPTRS